MTAIHNTFAPSQQGVDLYGIPPRDSTNGELAHSGRCRKETNQTVSVSTDLVEMKLCLKPNTAYSFSFDFMYNTTGLLCGAQFALTYSGTLVSGGYGINITTIANGTVGDATTTFGTFIGSGASVAGGGPKVARVFGCLVTGGTVGGELMPRAQPTGVGATVTVLANSTGKVEEQ